MPHNPRHKQKRRPRRSDRISSVNRMGRGRRKQPNEMSLLVDRADGATLVRNVNTGAERLVPPRGGFRQPGQPIMQPEMGKVPSLGGSM